MKASLISLAEQEIQIKYQLGQNAMCHQDFGELMAPRNNIKYNNLLGKIINIDPKIKNKKM